MKQKLIYLASPYSHKKKSIRDARVRQITKIAGYLTKLFGYAMFLPITQSSAMSKYEPSLKGDFKAWASIDLFVISKKADELWVVMMDGWRESIGVQAEIKCARRYKIPIKYIKFDPRYIFKYPVSNNEWFDAENFLL